MVYVLNIHVPCPRRVFGMDARTWQQPRHHRQYGAAGGRLQYPWAEWCGRAAHGRVRPTLTTGGLGDDILEGMDGGDRR